MDADTVQALRDAKALFDEGILSEQEFKEKKAELLQPKAAPVTAKPKPKPKPAPKKKSEAKPKAEKKPKKSTASSDGSEKESACEPTLTVGGTASAAPGLRFRGWSGWGGGGGAGRSTQR